MINLGNPGTTSATGVDNCPTNGYCRGRLSYCENGCALGQAMPVGGQLVLLCRGQFGHFGFVERLRSQAIYLRRCLGLSVTPRTYVRKRWVENTVNDPLRGGRCDACRKWRERHDGEERPAERVEESVYKEAS